MKNPVTKATLQLNPGEMRAVSAGRLWAVWSIMMVVAAALLRFQFLQGLGTNAPYITFYPAVVIAALYGGLRAGFLTLTLSAAVGIYFWVEPVHTFTVRNGVDWLLLVTFLTTTALISFVTEAMHRARARAHAAMEREAAALAQREAEARLRFSVQSANIGLWDWDLKTNAVSFSREWKSQIGYREDEISNQFDEWQSRVHPDDLEATMQKVREFIESPQDGHNVEFRIRHKDGSYRWIYAIADVLRGTDGMPVRLLICHLDITQRKSHEREIERWTRFYATLSQINQAIVRVKSHEELGREVARVSVEFGGFKLAWVGQLDIQARKITPLSCAGEPREFILNFRHSADGEAKDECFCGRVVRANQPTISNDLQTFPEIHDWRSAMQHAGIRAAAVFPVRVGGAVWGVFGVYSGEPDVFQDKEIALLEEAAMDIGYAVEHIETEQQRRQAEEALREDEERLQSVMRGSQLGYWDWDLETHEVTRNARWAEMLGYELQEVNFTVKQWIDFVHPEDQAAANQSIQDHLQGRTPMHRLEYRMRAKDGHYKWILDQAQVVRWDAAGRPLRMSGTHTDITERKRQEEELKASERMYRSLFETGPDGIVVNDAQGRFLDVNAKACELLGCRRDELLAMRVSDLIPPEERHSNPPRLADVLSGRVVCYERKLLHKDGTRVDVELRASKVSEGTMQAFWRDITERKRVEEDLERTRNTLVEAQKIAHLGSFEYIAATRTTVWSEEEYRIYGLDPSRPSPAYDEMLAKYIHPDDAALLHETFTQAMRNRSIYELEHRIVRPDGSVRWVHDRSAPFYDEQGELVRYIGTTLDITERKRAKVALRASENEFRSLAEAMPQIVWITRPDGWNIYFNQQWMEYTGLTVEESYGHGWNKPFHPDDKNRAWDAWQNAIQHNATYSLECRLRRADGDYRWWLIRGVPLRDEGGTILKWFGTCTDIDDIKQSEAKILQLNESLREHSQNLEQRVAERTAELAEARDQAESANRAKSTFLANMSHEIRTPMTSILGFTQLLRRDTNITSHQRQQLETIERSGRHLLELINTILEMSKIEAGHMAAHPVHFDLLGLLGDLERMFQLRAEAKNLRFSVSFPRNLPHHIVADQPKLRQVLINVVGNAVKFTETGRIDLRVHVASDAAGGHRLIAEIEDTGPGIRPEEIERLFQPFTQVGGAVHSAGGTGLGLTISRDFSRLMGGDLTVVSRFGEGSVFRLEVAVEVPGGDMPTHVSAPCPAAYRLKPAEPQRHILVVDDRQENCLLLEEMLGRAGFQVRCCDNGEKALEENAAWQPDAILLDLRMPEMDGREVIRQIRSDTETRRVKIICVTASAFEEDRQRVLTLGADDFIAKPFLEAELFDKLQSCLGVEYVGHDQETSGAEELALAREGFVVLGPDLLNQLRSATLRGDFEVLNELVNGFEADHPRLARGLRELADGFESERILELLGEENTA